MVEGRKEQPETRGKPPGAAASFSLAMDPQLRAPGTAGRGRASLPYPDPLSQLLPSQLPSVLPLPFLPPCPFLAALLLFSPSTWGAAPTLQVLPAPLPLTLEPSSGAAGGNQGGKEQPLQPLFLWPGVVLADSWMNQALHRPSAWVRGTPGSDPALQPLEDPQPIPVLHSPRQLLHPHPAPEGFTGELQSPISPFLGSTGLSVGTSLKIRLGLQLDLLQCC